jgi:hypothetical protein
MAELKTKQTDASVEKFLSGIADEKKKNDCFTVLEIMKQATRSEPKMWGTSIVGFGSYCYRYQSGRELSWFLTGFSPRKEALTLYVMPGSKGYNGLLKKLGKHKTGKACLYIKRIEDIDLPTLKELIRQSVAHMTKAAT